MSKSTKAITDYFAMPKNFNSAKYNTEHFGKSGKFKGSKKEKKVMKDTCQHYRMKGNKKVPMFRNIGNNTLECRCGAQFPAKFGDTNAVKKVVNSLLKYVDQMLVVNNAVDGGRQQNEFLAGGKIFLQHFTDTYTSGKKVAEKQDKIKNKKKKGKGRNSYGNNSRGGWQYK